MKPLFFLLALPTGLLSAQTVPWTIGPDRVTEGAAVARATDGSHLSSTGGAKEKRWSLGTDLSALPRVSTPESPLLEALWNLSLEEVLKDRIEGGSQDGGLSAGAHWPGVWTRDVSYAAHLSLAWLFPDAVKTSLRLKTTRGVVLQDTGTGGAWPVSTDRVVWALAARELARSTGDASWKAEAYGILRATAEADRANVFDQTTGLYFGETSFLDWREQSYPLWYQPADIFQSPATGTNAAHRALYATLEAWSRELGRPASETQTWHERGQALAEAINAQLRRPDGTFAAYRYSPTAGGGLSNRTDALGNALAVITGVASQPETVIEHLPLEPFGPPVIFPQLAHAGPYHNKTVWPFVTAYYGWAAQQAGRPGAAAFAFEANLRAAALLLTNQENLVHDTGSPEGSLQNSERQLWSVAGLLGGVLHTLLGLNFDDESLRVAPIVPAWVKGPLMLSGLSWQGRTLSVRVTGTGSQLTKLTVNGTEVSPSAELKLASFPVGSAIRIEATLAGDPLPLPPTLADVTAKGPWDATSLVLGTANQPRTLTWKTRAGVARSVILANGVPVGETTGNRFDLPAAPAPLTAWSVTTYNDAGWPATRAEPVLEAPGKVTVSFPDRDLGELVGDQRTFSFEVARPGKTLIRFRYTNTAGPINTDNKACLRSLSVDGGPVVGSLVFPQRGYVSTNRGWSSSLVLDLSAGSHTIALTFTPDNANMDGTVNRAVVDTLEALPLE